MWLAAELMLVLLLLLIGIRLSAFFSGTETGFYRLSLPRLGIDAQAGDRGSQRLLWFARHPSFFVATTLVGNNIANYITTVAISWIVVLVAGRGSESAEVIATLLFSPILFLFGELLPKNVYYRAPMSRMRRQIRWFDLFYKLALPISFPLVLLTRLVERISRQPQQAQEMLPGRGRFMQMIGHGHTEGILTTAQSTMATGILQVAYQGIQQSMTPASRVFGTEDSADREEILSVAKRYGLTSVPLYQGESSKGPRWTAYVRVCELVTTSKPPQAVRHPMPQISFRATRLEAIAALHDADALLGCVVDSEGDVLGIVSENGLVDILFRPTRQR